MRFLLFLTQIEEAWEKAPPGEPERVYEQYMEVERELKEQGKLVESLRLRSRNEAKTPTFSDAAQRASHARRTGQPGQDRPNSFPDLHQLSSGLVRHGARRGCGRV